MKINFQDYNLEEFNIKEGDFMGIPSKLITPKEIGAKFTQKNKIFRSSIWDLDGNLLSASFPKFVNWGENPENFPVPVSLDGCKLLDKVDGSTCIIDYIDGRISMRTRGTFSYIDVGNPQDFEICLENHPKIIEFLKEYPQISLLCEITTPNQKIIINYGGEPKFWLIGAIDKTNYLLMPQHLLDNLAQELEISRPEYYQFNSVNSLLTEIGKLEGAEGCCVYSSCDQEIHKVKAAKYLILHRAKSAISSFDKVLDIFIELKCPTYDEFYSYVETTFDFELAEIAKDNIKLICGIYDRVKTTIDELNEFVIPLRDILRKDAALKIIEKYKEKQLDSFAFLVLNNRELDDKNLKKLIYITKEND